MNFLELPTTKIGTLGEELIAEEFAKSKNSKLYRPAWDGSFPVDSLAITGSRIYGLEVKTKPRMKYFEETGMDSADHETYMRMPFPVYILFIDWLSGSVYGQWISKLDKQKRILNNVTLYPLSLMIKHRDLTTSEVSLLKEGCNSNYYGK